jgi:protein-tyrosine phosphatase
VVPVTALDCCPAHSRPETAPFPAREASRKRPASGAQAASVPHVPWQLTGKAVFVLVAVPRLLAATPAALSPRGPAAAARRPGPVPGPPATRCPPYIQRTGARFHAWFTGLDTRLGYSMNMKSRTDMPSRRIQLEGAFNFRDLGGYRSRDGRHVRWRRIFRADNLSMLTDSDHRMLADMSLATVIDLRTHAEVERAGRIRSSGNYAYHHIPMADVLPDTTDRRWASAEFAANRYLDMLEGASACMRAALAIMADPSSHPVVFHCAAGKDRTGIVAVVVLGLLGVGRGDIIVAARCTSAVGRRQRLRHRAADGDNARAD